VRADVTIRYTYEMSSPMAAVANQSYPMVIYMRGNMGATVVDSQSTIVDSQSTIVDSQSTIVDSQSTVVDSQSTIVDFSKQQITIIDGARKKYATIAAADYAGKMAAQTSAETSAMMPDTSGVPGVADMLKSIKTTCDINNSDAPETIQGVKGVRHEVACTMTITMPENMKDVKSSMGMKMVTRVWSASPGERLRVPGLWHLSGYELWQNYFMNPMGAADKMLPEGIRDGIKPMLDAMQKDQSAVLRSSTEISMNMQMPGLPAGDTPFMTMKEEMTGLSTELLDDSLFAVPADYSKEPFEAVMKGITDAAMATVKGDMDQAAGR
jgi:hypothetical protein